MASVSNTLVVKTAGTGLPPTPPTPPTPPPPTPTPPTIPQPPSTPPVIQPTVYEPLQTASQVARQPGMTTLLLDTQRWDLVLDANRNIALASPPYAMAQDAASAIRTFQGECWYDTTLGVPYFQQILGKQPPLGVLKNAFTTAAKAVPAVTSAVAYIASVNGRAVTGQVQLTTTGGTTLALTGVLQPTAPISDSAGNSMTDSSDNLMFTVV